MSAVEGCGDRATQPARGVLIDYCPTCGVSGGVECETPAGRKRSDHRDRVPECNGQGSGCNVHGVSS